MSPQVTLLLGLVPEERHDEFIRRLPYPAARAVLYEVPLDEDTLQTIAEAVWRSLEDEPALAAPT